MAKFCPSSSSTSVYINYLLFFILEDEIAGKITLKHLYEIAKILHGDPNGYYQIDTLQDVCNQLIKKAREIGIEIVRDLNPEEYSAFLKERKEFLDNYDKRMQEIQEAKLMRTA